MEQKNTKLSQFIFLNLVWIGFLLSCGAPLKKPGEIDLGETKTLKEKFGLLCDGLKARKEEPTLERVEVSSEFCGRPGAFAQNYNPDEKNLGFSLLSSKEAEQGDSPEPFFTFSSLVEVWLGRSVIEMVTAVFSNLKSDTESVLGSNPDSPNQDFSFEVHGDPQFDRKNFTISVEITIESPRTKNGFTNIKNTFKVRGYLDKEHNAFVASVISSRDATLEESLIKSAKILAVVVPHAGDIFINIATTFDIYSSYGVDKAIEEVITQTLASGLKAIPDLMAKIQR